jgi:putative DNA primase/helicase
LDEISQANADALAEIIYMLANERGKARMTANITMRATKNWRVAIASTGEKTVAQKVAESHGKKTAAGVEMRLISVSADAGNGHGVFDTIDGYKHGSALAMEMAGNATRAYGTAGPSFARAIIEKGVIEVGIEARRMIDDFVSKHTPKNASPQALRVAKRFGLIAAAGELAIEYNILLPWPKGCVEEAAAWAYDRWAKEIGANKGMIEDRQAVEQIRRLIEEYGDSRFDDIYVSDHTKKPEPVEGGDDYDAIKEPIEGASHKQYDERPVFTRYGYRRGEGEGKNWLVSSQVWREVFCKGFDPAYVAGLLAKQGKLNRRGKNLVNSFKINGKEHPGYILNSNILDNEEEENVDEDAA